MKKIYLLITTMIMMTSCVSPLKKQDGQQSQNKEKKTIGSVFKDAFTSGKSMRCTYLVGQTEVETLIKGNKTRVNGMGYGQGAGGMINDGEWVYIWNDDNKTGTKYNIEEIKALNEESTEKAENNDQVPKEIENPQEWAAKMEEQYEIKCENANISDSEFVPPVDIAFNDMGEYMKKANELSKKFEGKTEFNEEDINELNKMGEDFSKTYGGDNPQETEVPESEE